MISNGREKAQIAICGVAIVLLVNISWPVQNKYQYEVATTGDLNKTVPVIDRVASCMNYERVVSYYRILFQGKYAQDFNYLILHAKYIFPVRNRYKARSSYLHCPTCRSDFESHSSVPASSLLHWGSKSVLYLSQFPSLSMIVQLLRLHPLCSQSIHSLSIFLLELIYPQCTDQYCRQVGHGSKQVPYTL